jgi:hypothetical protein
MIKNFKQNFKISTQDHPFENLNQLFEFLNGDGISKPNLHQVYYKHQV